MEGIKNPNQGQRPHLPLYPPQGYYIPYMTNQVISQSLFHHTISMVLKSL